MVCLDSQWDDIAVHPATAPVSAVGPANLAYVIYTSGSTGEPKGVMVEHRNVARLFTATEHLFQFAERDVWTLIHSFAFDFSVWELWGALLSGGRLIVVPYLMSRSPREFYSLICREKVTVLSQTPSAFAQLIDAQARRHGEDHSLRLIIFGGEALEMRMLRPWVERNGTESPQLVNMYGITETTVHVTYCRLTEREIRSEGPSSIGKPIADLRTYLLDRHRQLVPVGVAGEIYIEGAGVTRGYLDRPTLTAERFIADPFAECSCSRMYQSGDLGRWLEDGSIEYLGRNDEQVKIRGFRIELGEIEAAIGAYPVVRQAVVVVREGGGTGRQLIAYLKCLEGSGLDMAELRAYLKGRLPEYMIPTGFVTVEAFPLTLNGKVDRKALPALNIMEQMALRYVAPRTATEVALCEIWSHMLGLERVGIDDDFFEVGGESLLAMRIVAKIREKFGAEVSVMAIFEAPTIAALSERIGKSANLTGGSVKP
jgi:amino acid adenylation domain-containing protein